MSFHLAAFLIAYHSLSTPLFARDSAPRLAKVKVTKKKNYRPRSPRKIAKQTQYQRPQSISLHWIGNYFGQGLGISYGKQISSTLSYGLRASFTQAQLEGDVGVATTEILDAATKRISGFGSFKFLTYGYVNLNLALSYCKGDYSLYETDSSIASADIPFTAGALHADLALGTRWELKQNFFVAVDWFGFGYILASSVKVRTTPEYEDIVEFTLVEGSEDRLRGEIAQQLQRYYVVTHFGYRF